MRLNGLLLTKAKRLAKERGVTLTCLVEIGLRHVILSMPTRIIGKRSTIVDAEQI